MNIATRAEQAAPDETRGLLGDLYAAIYQKQQGWASPVNLDQFNARLDCEAYLDAAMMLVPEGAAWTVQQGMSIGRPAFGAVTLPSPAPDIEPPDFQCFAATPALALIAAIARSVE